MKKNAVIVLSLCGLFLFFKYIAQLFPSLVVPELLQTAGYDGVMIAIMASSYYYSYSIMQIIAGLIIDRYSIKFPMFLSIFSISAMMLVFTHTTNFYLMCLSRVIMGAGASFATVIYMKSAAYYTSPKTFSVISSFLATATMLGAACGGTPIALLFQRFGWHAGLNGIAVLGFSMAALVLLSQNKKTMLESPVTQSLVLKNIKEVLTKRDNWLLLIYSGFTFSPVAILGGLWGTPFLMAKYSLSATDVSFLLSVMFVGHAVGSPLWALLSLKIQSKKTLMHIANGISLLAISILIYGNIPYFSEAILFFIFGFSVGCFMLSFQLCREINALYVMGLAIAFINSGEGLVGSCVEPLIGRILDVSKVGAAFTLANYQTALFILPCCFILSSCTLLFVYRQRFNVEIQNLARVSNA